MSANWNQAAELMRTMRRSTSLFPFLATDVVSGFVALSTPWVSFPIQIFVLAIFGCSVISTLIACIFFMIKDPDRLGSEIHSERKRALDMLVGDEQHSLGTRAEHIVAVVNSQNPISDSDVMELPSDSEIQERPLNTDSLRLE
jgi:hypothetical protein